MKYAFITIEKQTNTICIVYNTFSYIFLTRVKSGRPFGTHAQYYRFLNQPVPPCTHMCTFRVTPPPHFCIRDFTDLIPSLPVLILLVCHSFLIYFFTSELHKSRIKQLISFFCLRHSPLPIFHLIQFLLAYGDSPFGQWWLQAELLYLLQSLTNLSYAKAIELLL